MNMIYFAMKIFHVRYIHLVISILLSLILIIDACPEAEDIYPCTCTMRSYGSEWVSKIYCVGIDNQDVLDKSVREMQYMGRISYFIIEKGEIMYFPHDIFKDIKIDIIQMISTSFIELTDTDTAFEGIEETLKRLSIIKCQMLNEWNWAVLRKLRNLVFLRIEIEMERIAEDIKKMYAPNLETLLLNYNKISNIHEEAFSAFGKLQKLELEGNLISAVKRSMLPRPANFLESLTLSKNKIEEIPPDMFEDMPRLKYVDLLSNKIVTLNEKAFSSALKYILFLDARDNPLQCDCKLSWLTTKKIKHVIKGFCNEPSELKGTSLKDLNANGEFESC